MSGTQQVASGSPLVFDVAGMDCGDCARSVERVVGRLPDVDEATVSFAAGTLTVTRQDEQAAHDDVVRSIGAAVDRAGYSATLRETACGCGSTARPGGGSASWFPPLSRAPSDRRLRNRSPDQ